MAETVNYSVENQLGCGFMNVIFQNRFFGQSRSSTKPLLPSSKNNSPKLQSVVNKLANKPLPQIDQKTKSPVTVYPKRNLKNSRTRHLDSARNSTSSSSKSTSELKRESLSRASSGNIIVSSANSLKPTDSDKRTTGTNTVTGNILRKNSGEMSKYGNICKGITIVSDPEVVKNKGNEKYKMGKFGEALAMYNEAISLDPKNAVYYSNKGAALIGLGRLIEAVFECREAVRIEPCYHRAHYRLATLYFRLGEAEKAQHHYTLSKLNAASDDIHKSRAMKRHVSACKRAIEINDWDSLLKESQYAISLGADSAPEIVTMKVDALLNLHKHKEAYEALVNAPKFDMNSSCSLFGEFRSAYILSIRAQVYTVIGRFVDAQSAINQASRLDTSYKTNAVMKKVEAVLLARVNGNQFFKAFKFLEAISAYNEGLQIDPYNSVLLSNRAACKFKLGWFEKAVDDCTKALHVRPCYNKARLRRANCYAELGKWEGAINDYEMLARDTPDDKELAKYLFEARAQIQKATS